jgi:hypothetical protein
MPTIAVSGSLAQRPARAGHAWVFISYLLGFRALGHEVLFIDRLERDMVAGGQQGPLSSSREVRWLVELMDTVGLDDSYVVLLDGNETIGLSRADLSQRLSGDTLLLNINGFLTDDQLLETVSQRVYVDIDPGFAQMWEELGLATMFDGHDKFVTVGENVGQEGCEVPTAGRHWISTRTPILLDRWPMAPKGLTFTSVGSWRGPFEPISYRNDTYGLRAHEFREFARLPSLVEVPFEIALDIDPADDRDLRALRDNRWSVIDPVATLGDLAEYRRFIQESMAEIAIAKGMYVKTRGGWFSDRSASYLASGKPVLAQDTGFGDKLPTGDGLLKFSNLDEAVAGVEDICSDWKRHSEAARAVAEEYFDAGKVLSDLLVELGAG